MIWESWAFQSLYAEKSIFAHAYKPLDFLNLAFHLVPIRPLTLLGFVKLSLSFLPQIHFLIFLEIFQRLLCKFLCYFGPFAVCVDVSDASFC